MRAAVVAISALVCLLVGATVAQPNDLDLPSIKITLPNLLFREDTPAPNGLLKCELIATVGKAPGAAAVYIYVKALQGEIYIPTLGIGDGREPACEPFPPAPDEVLIFLPTSSDERSFNMEILLHAHDNNQCNHAGEFQGVIGIRQLSVLADLDIYGPFVVCGTSTDEFYGPGVPR